MDAWGAAGNKGVWVVLAFSPRFELVAYRRTYDINWAPRTGVLSTRGSIPDSTPINVEHV